MEDLRLSAREGEGKTNVRLALSKNTQSAFFPYLYLDGFAGGVIYHETQGAAEALPGARVVIGINPNQNITLGTMAAVLHEAEVTKRRRLGLPLTPSSEEAQFFKTVSNGTLIISYGQRADRMLALTADEIMQIIREVAS